MATVCTAVGSHCGWLTGDRVDKALNVAILRKEVITVYTGSRHNEARAVRFEGALAMDEIRFSEVFDMDGMQNNLRLHGEYIQCAIGCQPTLKIGYWHRQC